MEEARSRVELAIIQSDHQAHAATCVASAGNRQNDVAQAILAGGGSATVAAAINRLELMDRKVTAILRDALEHRQAANPTAAVRTTPKHGSR